MRKRKIIGMDTESTKVDIKNTLSRLGAKVEGLSASWNGQDAVYLTKKADIREALNEANRLKMRTIWHNYKFDTMVLLNSGLPEPLYWEDTAIAGRLLNENRVNKLKVLAEKLLGIKDPMVFEEAEKQKLLDPEVFAEYAKNDAKYDYQLWEMFYPQLKEQQLEFVYNLEKKMVHPALEIELNGMRVNAPHLRKMGREVRKQTDALLLNIYKKAGKKFNLNSPAQLADVLFGELGLPVQRKSRKTGKPSTDKETLQELEAIDETGIISMIGEFRKLDKLASGFLDALPRFLDEEDRIHATLNSMGATTGRTSSQNPNLQNIPVRSALGKELRSGFIPSPGNVMIISDYDQMELNFLAEVVLIETGDRAMFDILKSGKDLHIETAEAMFHKSVGKEDVERKIAKMVNFGTSYGITPMGLMLRLKAEGVNVTLQECEQFIELYFRNYPGVKELMDETTRRAQRFGYVTNIYGRRRHVRGWNQREQRQAFNFIIQGGCVDVAKCGMIDLYNEFGGTEVKAIGMVHDELLYDVPKKMAPKVLATVKEAMTITPPGFKFPLTVDAKIAKNWAEK